LHDTVVTHRGRQSGHCKDVSIAARINGESCLDSKLALLGKNLHACDALATFEQTTFGFIAQLRCGRWIVCARS
jgi:hypothetical protein